MPRRKEHRRKTTHVKGYSYTRHGKRIHVKGHSRKYRAHHK